MLMLSLSTRIVAMQCLYQKSGAMFRNFLLIRTLMDTLFVCLSWTFETVLQCNFVLEFMREFLRLQQGAKASKHILRVV
jgi:hypothetical protein